jgi:hypothetical protein
MASVVVVECCGAHEFKPATKNRATVGGAAVGSIGEKGKMPDRRNLGEPDTTTYAEGYGDTILLRPVDNTGRQLAQVVVDTDEARNLVNILGGKLNVT